MTKEEEQIRTMTVIDLWNAEEADMGQLNAREMSEAKALERVKFWRQAAKLYRDRARAMAGTAGYMRCELAQQRSLRRQRERMERKCSTRDVISPT